MRFSEEVADKALQFLGIPRNKSTQATCPSAVGVIIRARKKTVQNISTDLPRGRGFRMNALETLFDRYGTRTETIAEFMKLADRCSACKSLPNYSKREILFLAQYERVEHLDDLLLRRTMLAMLGKLSREAVLECAEMVCWAMPSVGALSGKMLRRKERSVCWQTGTGSGCEPKRVGIRRVVESSRCLHGENPNSK